jgi:aryl-alcohol dehydrogenase-like predicted oxidoreductase
VTSAIVGARNAKQAETVFRAGIYRLSAQEVREIEVFSSGVATAKAAI